MSQRVNILGVGVSATNMADATSKIITGVVETGQVSYVTVTGAHGIIESTKSDSLREIHNDSYLTVPDGVPTVWVGKIYGHKDMERVYGPDLMASIFRQGEASAQKFRHFLWGASTAVVVKLRDSLLKKYPNADIVGVISPPYRDLNSEEKRELLAKINDSEPHFFWVGLSTPKQEKFMHGFLKEYRDSLDFVDKKKGFMMLGVGAAFDFHAGELKQAPSLLQNMGLEWLFRLLVEPKRLWRRYFRVVPMFMYKVIMQISGLKKY